MPVTWHAPHGSVLALLTHTVLTLDVWTQSAPLDTDAESRFPVAGSRESPELYSTSSGFVLPPIRSLLAADGNRGFRFARRSFAFRFA